MTTLPDTPRLILRTFKDADLTPMCAINQDPKVMKYFPATASHQQTKDHLQRIQAHQDKYGYSLYAVELKSTGEMIGFVGLLHRTLKEFDAPFIPATEIGWRLSSLHWNKGYATEAARAVLDHGFSVIKLEEIVSFSTVANQASRRVMEKIGLHHDPRNDFNHPQLEIDSPLRPHVLYRINKVEYFNLQVTKRKGERVHISLPAMHDMKSFLDKVHKSNTHLEWVSPPSNQEQYEKYLQRIEQENQHGYFLRLLTTNEIIGVININEIVRGCFQSAYLGYYLFNEYAQQGLMNEGLSLIIEHAFTNLALHRLEANIQPQNTRSINLIKALGFTHEGFSRKYLSIHNQ